MKNMGTKGATGAAGVSADEATQAAAAVEQAEEQQTNLEQAAKSDREIQMEAIKANRARIREQDHQDAVEMGIAAPKGVEEGEAKPADAPDPDAPVFKQDGKWVTRIKVNGEEKVVPWDTVLRTAQKSEAADVRLHQASETLRQAQARAKEIVDKAVVDADQRKGPKQPSSDGDVADVDLQAEAEKIVGELMEGDAKKGAAMLAQTLGRLKATPAQGQAAPAPAPISQDQIIATVVQVRDHEKKVDAVRECAKANPDLSGDPTLWRMVDAESARLLSDPTFEYESYHDVMREASKNVRTKITQVAGQTQGNASDSRRERKVAVASPGPGVPATARPAPAKEPQPLTMGQKLAKMREARGQA